LIKLGKPNQLNQRRQHNQPHNLNELDDNNLLSQQNPIKKDKKMELHHSQEGEITIITIKGRLDAASSPVAGNAIKKIMQEDCSRILFNFSDLEYLSSGGLRVILGVAKELKRQEGKLVLCSLNPFVKEIFVVSGFESLIPIEDTVESGIRQLDAN
jgi:anti-anti-sigma factor